MKATKISIAILLTIFFSCAVCSFEHFNKENAKEEEKMVLTPFGLIPKGCTFHVRDDETVSFDGSLLRIERRTKDEEGREISLVTLEKGAKCEHGKPIRSKDVHKNNHRNGAAAEPNGWAAYAKWLTSQDFSFFGGYWTVPETPSQEGLQTLFLFTGFQNSYFFATENDNNNEENDIAEVTSIIQPVLQWGSSEAGDEKYWAIASWFVAGENAVYSDLKGPLNSGDTIVGNMTLISGTKWTIETNDLTLGVSSTLTAVTSVSEVDAFITLEVYGISDCSDYPNGSTDFTNLYLEVNSKEVTADWSPDTEVGCQESVTIVSPTDVTIKF